MSSEELQASNIAAKEIFEKQEEIRKLDELRKQEELEKLKEELTTVRKQLDEEKAKVIIVTIPLHGNYCVLPLG